MKTIRIKRPFLAFGATLLASLVALADDAAILSSPTDVRDLLRDAQAARLPSPNVVTQDLGAAVVEPADASASAWFSAVGEGAAFAFEDPTTSDTVLTNPATGGASRLAAEPDYDPNGLFLDAGYDLDENADLLPFYDPSLVVLSMRLASEGESSPSSADRAADAGSMENSFAENDDSDSVGSNPAYPGYGGPDRSGPPYPGYAPGLLASYYEFPVALSSVPDFTDLVPDFEQVEDTLDHPDAASWPGIAMSGRHRFAARYVFDLFAPATADYELRVQSDDGSLVSIDGALLIDNDGVHGRQARFATVRLTHGFHRVEVGYFDEGWRCGLQLFWSGPDFATQIVPTNNVWHLVGDPDADDDGAPDWWESLYGFDPDSDGLSNLAEFLAGTNPLLADSDGDGMPDGWELANGLDASLDDAALDADGDGLTNLEEYRAGTNPNVRDSDGDGLSDYDELHGLGTDPTNFDFEADWRAYATLPAAQTVDRADVWSPKGDSLLSWRRGHVDWLFTTTNAAKGFLRVSASHFWHTVAPTAPLSARSRFYAYSGDDLLGVAFLDHAPGAEPALVRFPLPFLPAGPHHLRLVWDGIDPALGVCLHEAALETPGGPDENGDGLEDWVLAQSLTRDSVPASVSTVFSPACLEGSALAPTRVFLSFGTNALAATATGPSSWYADVPLAPGANPVSVSFEGGLRTAAASVSWVPFDVSSAATSLVARLGDTILLASPDTASVYVTANGLGRGTLSLAAGVPVQLLFDDSGLWRLVVSRPGASTVVHEVRILGGGFPDEDPAIILDSLRSWPCQNLPSAAVVSSDDSVIVYRRGANLLLHTATMRIPHRIVARIAADGPVLDVATLRPFWLRATPERRLRRVGAPEPDYEVWIDDVLACGVPDSIRLHASIVLSGTTFGDHSIEMDRNGTDFGPADHWPLVFYHSNETGTPACHTVQAYQGPDFLGSFFVNPESIPQEAK